MVIRLFCALTVLSSSSVALASADIGRVISLRGKASVTRATDTGYKYIRVERGMRIHEGDQVRTRSNAAIRIVFDDRSILNLGDDSSMVIQKYRVDRKKRKRSVGVRLWAGRVWARVSSTFGTDETNFEVKTSNAVAGVRGTSFAVLLDGGSGETKVTVFEGAVEVGPPDGGESFGIIKPGERSTVNSDGSGAKTETLDERSLEQARRKASSNGGLDPEGADERLNDAEEILDDTLEEGEQEAVPQDGEQGGTTPGEDESTPTDDDGGDDAAPPPLDLDPASGATRVRGRVEVRP